MSIWNIITLYLIPILENMGRVRTKTVKKASKVIIEKYYTRLTLDFHTNKRICEEIAIIPTKPLRNKIAGFVTHLMKRLRHSQVSNFYFQPTVNVYFEPLSDFKLYFWLQIS